MQPERYTAEQLRGLPTLAVGQADDLKIERAHTRVWLSRCTVGDGEPYNNKVTVERQGALGVWEVRETYPG